MKLQFLASISSPHPHTVATLRNANYFKLTWEDAQSVIFDPFSRMLEELRRAEAPRQHVKTSDTPRHY